MVRERIPKHREAEKAFEQQKAQEELLGLMGQIKALFGHEIKFDAGGRVVSKVRVSDVGEAEWNKAGVLISEIRQMVDKGAKIPEENLESLVRAKQ